MKSIFYNQDGTLSTEALFFTSLKPTNITLKEWVNGLKAFKSQLSLAELEEYKKFQKIKNQQREKNYRKTNQEKINQSHSDWRKKNSSKVKSTISKYRQKHKEQIKEYNVKNKQKILKNGREWRSRNKEKVIKWSKNYRNNNKEKMNKYTRNYMSKRWKEDELFRLWNLVRSHCYRVIKALSLNKKPTSTEKWVGCSPQELKQHIESIFLEGMTWHNYGKWHIDHIRPVSSFKKSEWKQVNHYTNLQPLWASDNMRKGNKWKNF